MFNFFKRFSAKKAAPDPAVAEQEAPAAAEIAEMPSQAPRREFSGEALEIPWSAVVGRVPEPWQSKISNGHSEPLKVPIERILDQLAKGCIRISLSELQEFRSAQWFPPSPDLERTDVELPLSEIVPRLKPEHYRRRGNQRRIEISEEIAPLFGPNGTPMEPTRHVTPPAPPSPHQAPVRAASAPAPAPAAPALAPPAPAKPQPVAAPAPIQKTEPAQPASVPAADTKLKMTPAPAPASDRKDAVVLPLSAVSAKWPEEIRASLAGVDLESAQVELPLDELEPGMRRGKLLFPWRKVRNWIRPPLGGPENLSESSVELPLALIAPRFVALRKAPVPQKKVEVSSAIPGLFAAGHPAAPAEPASAPAAPAPPAAIPAPAPVAPSKPAGSPYQVKPDEAAPLRMRAEAPAPSSPTPAAASTVARESAPAAAPAPANPSASAAPALPKPVLSFAEIFGQTGKSSWSPVEIVQSAALLKGVGGAFIISHDGLLVAGQSGSNLKLETVAGLITDLFQRAVQYSKEFQLPPPRQVTVSFEAVPLQIYQSGKIYFAALGRAGENLPKIQLGAIAAQLERRTPS